jgi:hypothetical protein
MLKQLEDLVTNLLHPNFNIKPDEIISKRLMKRKWNIVKWKRVQDFWKMKGFKTFGHEVQNKNRRKIIAIRSQPDLMNKELELKTKRAGAFCL